MATGFLVGESLLTRIKTSLDRQDGQPIRLGDASIPTRLQDISRGPVGGAFRICTFTAAWSKNTDKTVTFKYQTSTPNTVVATNLFADLAGSGTKNCAIAREGTAWYLIAAEC